MAGSQTEISVWQTLVQAVNNLATTLLKLSGQTNQAGISSPTIVSTGTGRLVSVSVIEAGSATGLVYDSANLSTTSRPIFLIPQYLGVQPVGIPTNYGIVVVPGSGQVVTVTYS